MALYNDKNLIEAGIDEVVGVVYLVLFMLLQLFYQMIQNF